MLLVCIGELGEIGGWPTKAIFYGFEVLRPSVNTYTASG
jgi:hypothetical protein